MVRVATPDTFAVLPPTGQLVGIEVKDVKGRLNANQVIFSHVLERAGGKYLVARSLDDVILVFGMPKWWRANTESNDVELV